MLERIEYLARVSVSRACGFAGLAIVTFFVGMSGDMPAAFRSAGMLSLLASLVLLLKAHQAPSRSYKKTELWLMLRPEERPEPAIAQQIIGTVLRETFLRFALHAAAVAAMMLVISLLYAATGS